VLKNYGSVKRDCGDALKLNPANTKALFRRAKACLLLRQYKDGLDAVVRALAVDPANGEVAVLRGQLEDGLAAQEKREAEAAAREAKAVEESKALWLQCAARGATLGPGLASDGYQQHSDKMPSSDPDGEGALAWPLQLLYPQHCQSDLIESVSEGDFLADHMATVFPEEQGPAPWDVSFEYRCSELEVYLQLDAAPPFTSSDQWAHWVKLRRAARGEVAAVPAETAAKQLRALEAKAQVHEDDQRWVRVSAAVTMGQLLRVAGHVAPGGVPTLYLYPRKSEAHVAFLKRHKGRVSDLDLASLPPPPPPTKN